MSFSRYSEYKDSGVEWLGQVPAHWRALRLRWLCGEPICNGVGEASDQDDPANPRYIRITDIADSRHLCDDSFRSLPPEIAERAPVKVGDILLAAVGATYGKSYLHSQDIGPACFAGYLVKFTPANKICSAYIAYWTESAQYWAQVNSRVIQSTVQNFSASRFRELTAPVPPYSEQVLIAEFLDREVERIDGLVAQQERLIALLKEKRQAVISHAVTKGLDPNVPMKDSGIEWLGEVPEHWQIVPLGRITVDRCDGPFGSGLKSEHYSESGVRVIRLQNIRRDGFDGADAAYIDENYSKSLPGHDVVFGDVLVAGLGDDNNTLGRACVAPRDIEPAMVKADCFRFRLDTRIAFPEFIATQLTAGSEPDAGILATGTTRSRIPLSVMASRRVILPPLGEQKAIVKLLAGKAELVNALLAEATKGIDLLKERRSALISAAVTGKIDVRQYKAKEVA